MENERIQKLIAEAGFCSRRKAEELISEGRVKKNGNPVKLGDKAGARDIITIDGERISVPRKRSLRYIMIHKPRGYVTTMNDELGRKTAAELLVGVRERVYPVGRLDKGSEGLLLFTNDGELANDIMHPSHHVTKTYRVTVRPPVTDEALVKMSEGVLIDGKKTMPCVINVLDEQPNRVVLQFVIREGRNRQIRKMCEAVGLEVARLKRTAIGPLKLGMLQPGEFRDLTNEELRALRTSLK